LSCAPFFLNFSLIKKKVRLKISLNLSAGCNLIEEAVGSDGAEKLLLSFLQQGYLLNPNLSDIKEKKEHHGFVLIAVAGTVHKNEACLGIFEHLFCLLRDPGIDFKWRILWAELRVTQMTVHQMPGVSDLPDLKKAMCEYFPSYHAC